MNFTEGAVYHVYNRGNNKQKIFFTDANYIYFLKKMVTELSPYCDILTYSLMPNHFHLIIVVKSGEVSRKPYALNNAFAVLLRSYTRAIQKQENFTGSLFQQKTKAKKLLDQDDQETGYLIACAHYIHQNPKKASLVKEMGQWLYSSYRDYAQSNGTVCNSSLFYLLARTTKDVFIKGSDMMITEKIINKIE